ncbi:MAG: hypothetical protein Q8M69_20165, partial [Reyranella sp.]|nr:hypothetical protein [Reyranella sp.]
HRQADGVVGEDVVHLKFLNIGMVVENDMFALTGLLADIPRAWSRNCLCPASLEWEKKSYSC